MIEYGALGSGYDNGMAGGEGEYFIDVVQRCKVTRRMR